MLSRDGTAVVAPAYPAYRPYRASVSRVLTMSPHLSRVTFTGPDLAVGWSGFDQRIKLVFPLDGTPPDIGADDEAIRAGDWYARWRALPDDQRCPIRTYTIRAARPERREVDVDMVLHPGGDGPAVRWLRAAAPGDELVLVAPDPRSTEVVGLDWRPGNAGHLLLVGDETAAPAICTILEQSPGTAQAFIEVPTAADILSVYPRGRSRVTWLARDGGCTTAEGFRPVAPRGALTGLAVRRWLARHTTAVGVTGVPTEIEDVDVDTTLLWESPPDPTTGGFYAWVAGEAAVVRDLRRLLVGEVGVARSNAAFMGYWRDGRPEPQ